MTRSDGSRAISVHMTFTSVSPGLMVKTRQQRSEEGVATRTSVTPADAGLGRGLAPIVLGLGEDDSIADEVQALIQMEITTHRNTNRRIPATPVESYVGLAIDFP